MPQHQKATKPFVRPALDALDALDAVNPTHPGLHEQPWVGNKGLCTASRAQASRR
ncbi:hypothetical protein [Streptomyces caeruleatus]|uniref:hypothetical protein n=1 Tax=Streptomyces caeruleatus TaxID=661399 RepID=UPI00131AA8E2|nr:hypothetical protein [Streptomyces caeruleatus]